VRPFTSCCAARNWGTGDFVAIPGSNLGSKCGGCQSCQEPNKRVWRRLRLVGPWFLNGDYSAECEIVSEGGTLLNLSLIDL